MQTVKNLLLYGGLDKEQFAILLPDVRTQNQTYLRIYSAISACLFLLLTLAGMATAGFISANATAFTVCFGLSLAILVCSWFVTPLYPKLTGILMFLFEIMLYAFSIAAAFLHTDMTAVSIVAFLLMTPLLFYDRPVSQAMISIVVGITFSQVVRRVKPPAIAEADMWNVLSYDVVGIGVGIFTMQNKFKTLFQAREIVYLSETDSLTGTKNGTYFKQRLEEYPALCVKGILCVYADVDGLREVNDTSGREAGDQLLCTVAEELREHFGAEHVYRLGGDEFVAFGLNMREEAEVSDILETINRHLGALDRHVTFGVSGKAWPVKNVEVLVRRAENAMYRAKSEYYQRPEYSRRKQ